MTDLRTAADDPALDRTGAPPKRPLAPPPADPLAARLQARLEAIEASPDALEPMRRRTPRLPAPEPVDDGDVIADLNRQLDVLRDQLDAAFEDSDQRIAEAQAAADAAQAHVTAVVAAVEELTTALHSLEASRPADVERVRAGIARFRERVRTH